MKFIQRFILSLLPQYECQLKRHCNLWDIQREMENGWEVIYCCKQFGERHGEQDEMVALMRRVKGWKP